MYIIFIKPRRMHERSRLASTHLYVNQQGRAWMCRSTRRTVATVTAVGWVPEGVLHQPPCKKVPEHIWVPAGALQSHDRLSFTAKPLDWCPCASLWSVTLSLEFTKFWDKGQTVEDDGCISVRTIGLTNMGILRPMQRENLIDYQSGGWNSDYLSWNVTFSVWIVHRYDYAKALLLYITHYM